MITWVLHHCETKPKMCICSLTDTEALFQIDLYVSFIQPLCLEFQKWMTALGSKTMSNKVWDQNRLVLVPWKRCAVSFHQGGSDSIIKGGRDMALWFHNVAFSILSDRAGRFVSTHCQIHETVMNCIDTSDKHWDVYSRVKAWCFDRTIEIKYYSKYSKIVLWLKLSIHSISIIHVLKLYIKSLPDKLQSVWIWEKTPWINRTWIYEFSGFFSHFDGLVNWWIEKNLSYAFYDKKVTEWNTKSLGLT